MANIVVRVTERPDGHEVYAPIDATTGRLALTGITLFRDSKTRAESRAKLTAKLNARGHGRVDFERRP